MRVASRLLLLWLLAAGVAAGQDTNFATGPQYLMNYGSPIFLHPISTPSIAWQSPLLEVGASDARSGLSAGPENRTTDSLPQPAPPADLSPIYYGEPAVSEVEISFSGNEGEAELEALPASILDVGTWQMTTIEALHERGYGVSLAEAAAYWKTHPQHATHAYGNGDIERLHQNN